MIARRDLLLGASCAVAAVGANVLKPHRPVRLLTSGTVADIVPTAFGEWQSQDVGDPLAINGPGTLSAKLYNQLITRLYTNKSGSAQVTVLLAYGAQQTADLQLHRPEICYPAFGYALSDNQPIELALGGGVQLPARELIAKAEQRTEGVIYWSRVGEYLPTSGREQRKARLETSLRGVIPDGILSRFSTATEDPRDAWPVLKAFIPELLNAVPANKRNVLIGTSLAKKMMA